MSKGISFNIDLCVYNKIKRQLHMNFTAHTTIRNYNNILNKLDTPIGNSVWDIKYRIYYLTKRYRNE